MDFYSASGIPILWCCFFQTIAIGWIFGANKFGDCVAQMTGYQPHKYWIWTWGVIAPTVMAVSNLTLGQTGLEAAFQVHTLGDFHSNPSGPLSFNM